jgi:hypothetical protein
MSHDLIVIPRSRPSPYYPVIVPFLDVQLRFVAPSKRSASAFPVINICAIMQKFLIFFILSKYQ